MISLTAAALILAALAVPSGPLYARDGDANGPPSKRPATTATTQPVIELWNDGVYPLGLKPFLLFAAWEDGTIVRRTGDANKRMGGAKSIHDWAERKLVIGSVDPSEVAALQAAIAKAGFFRPPTGDGFRFVDGPSQTLVASQGKARRLLSHHGPSDKWLREAIGKTGPTSGFPLRGDVQAFADMWDKVLGLLDAVAPKDLAEFKGQRKLSRPEAFDATDASGDPSIAYWGVPEYNEQVAHAGTPRAVVTMTKVQVATRETYEQLKQAGKARNEERHGVWVYFATSGTVQIPNDTGFMGLTTRYKVRLP